MSRNLLPRPTAVPIALHAALFAPSFVLFVLLTRLVHAGGHLALAATAGAHPLGFFSPLVGSDLAYLEYPDLAWSGKMASLPFFVGGIGVCFLAALFVAYLWPPSFSVPSRLLPLQLAAVLLVHGAAEPLADFNAWGESRMMTDLLGWPIWIPVAAVTAGAALLVAHLSLKAVNLGSVVSHLPDPRRRLLFAAVFFSLPEAVFQIATFFLGSFDPLRFIVGGFLVAVPLVAVSMIPARPFHQRIDEEGTGRFAVIGWLLAPASLVLWFIVFGGFSQPRARGIVWGSPGPTNNIRPETPYRRLSQMLRR